MERSKYEIVKEDVEMWIGLAICAFVVGMAYGIGKNLCNRLFAK